MKALFLATMILLQSCSNKAATTSRLQDLPLDQQSPLVQTLAGLSSEELDELFQSGQALDFANKNIETGRSKAIFARSNNSAPNSKV